MKATLCSFGAAEEVTGSKHMLEFDGRRVLLDCGMFQGRRAEAREKNSKLPFDAGQADAVLLSHAHFDHTGALPVLTKEGFSGNVYCTSATREIGSLIMMDSAYLQAKDAEYVEKRRKKGHDRDEPVPVEPLYDADDVLRSLDQVMTVSYHRTFPVAEGMRASFYDAGHILGSCLTVVECGGDGSGLLVGYTGDLGREGMAIIRNPEVLPGIDYLICESTYGNRRHDPMEQAMEELSELVNRTYKNRGKVIIPAFAVERTQELVYYLHLLYDKGRIPEIPIFVDSPMAVNATSIFRTHPECYDSETREAFIDNRKNPFGFETLRFVTSTDESKSLNAMDEPAVIISSSGMCEGGRILHHLANNVSDPKNTVLIVGFMAAHTLGRRLADRATEVKIFGQKYPVKARVKILNAFSAHADYEEIKAWTTKLDKKRLKGVFLVHGEPEAQANLKEVLQDQGIKRVEIMKFGEKVELKKND